MVFRVLQSALEKRLQAGSQSRPGLLSQREGRLATLMAALAVFVIATLPGPTGGASLFGWDKLDHISALAAITLLARAGWPRAARWITAGALFSYGLLIETAQMTPLVGRTASVSDMIANLIGIGLGLAIAFWLGRIARTLSWMPRRP